MEATRDPIKDDLAHFLDGLTGEGQVMDTLVKWLKGNVKAGGRIINIHQELFGGLGLRREGVAEYCNGGRIIMEIIEKRGEPVDDTKKKGSLRRDVRTTFEILSLVALIIASFLSHVVKPFIHCQFQESGA
jgi:hypothetical protein